MKSRGVWPTWTALQCATGHKNDHLRRPSHRNRFDDECNDRLLNRRRVLYRGSETADKGRFILSLPGVEHQISHTQHGAWSRNENENEEMIMESEKRKEKEMKWEPWFEARKAWSEYQVSPSRAASPNAFLLRASLCSIFSFTYPRKVNLRMEGEDKRIHP